MLNFKEWLNLQEMFGTQAPFSPNTKTAPDLNKGCAGGPGVCPKPAGGGAMGGSMPSPAPGPMPPKKQKKK